jgi:hypothetical protein
MESDDKNNKKEDKKRKEKKKDAKGKKVTAKGEGVFRFGNVETLGALVGKAVKIVNKLNNV